MRIIVRRFKALGVIAFLLFGCSRIDSHAAQKNSASARMPPAGELNAISAPPRLHDQESKQECLGRIAWSVNANFQLPTNYDGGIGYSFWNSFSRKVFNESDATRIGVYRIAVFEANSAEQELKIRSEMPAATIEQYRSYIRNYEEILKNLRKEGNQPDHVIDQYRRGVSEYHSTIDQIRRERYPFDPGIPDSEGFGRNIADGGSNSDNYSVYRAYVKRGKYIFIFESTREIDGPEFKKNHEGEFAAFLKKFRPRAANEIPSEIGLCVPFGFIQDDGTTESAITQSFRMPDAPGVIYTIETGSHARSRTVPAIKAIGTASVGEMGTAEEEEIKTSITERIGPRAAKIGGLSATQGGVAARIAEPGIEPYETYQVFTGYSGFPDAEALPFIHVKMSTVTMQMAPELKQNPPPFKQSLQRYESLLQGIYLRPTTPAMPDFARAGGPLSGSSN